MKKWSVIGVVMAILMSIILIPVSLAFNLAGGAVYATSSLISNERKDDLYRSFVNNGGISMLYDEIEKGIKSVVDNYSGAQMSGLEDVLTDVITERKVEEVVSEIYEMVVSGDKIKIDLNSLADDIMEGAEDYLDRELETYVENNLLEIYDGLSADNKETIKAEAKKIFMEEVEKEIEEEIATFKKNNPYASTSKINAKRAELLEEAEDRFDREADSYIRENIEEIYAKMDASEKQRILNAAEEEILNELDKNIVSAIRNIETELETGLDKFFESEEYEQVEEIQDTYGFDIYDWDDVHTKISIASFICFGIGAFTILLLLLCYGFRPSGFFVSGLFVGALGFGMRFIGEMIMDVAEHFLEDIVEEAAKNQENLVWSMIEDVVGWFTEGWQASGLTLLCAGGALILLGILVLVLRRNKETA